MDPQMVIYEWQRSKDGLDWNNIEANNTKSLYELKSSDKNHKIRVKASYIDLDGYTEEVYSNTVDINLPVNNGSGEFSVRGVPAVGEMLKSYKT